MYNLFRKYDFGLAKDREKMIWTDRDLALVAIVFFTIGFIIGCVQ